MTIWSMCFAPHGTVTQRITYTYDAFDRRISKTVNNDNDSTIDRRESYVYDGEDVVFDFVDSDGDGSAQTLKLESYNRKLWMR